MSRVIDGELTKLGITVSERTVSRMLRRRRRPPSQSWRTFLTNHVGTLVSMDFFTVSTVTGRVLVLLAHQRRRIIHLNVTEHPTAMWTAQQMIEAFPDDTAPPGVQDQEPIQAFCSGGPDEALCNPVRLRCLNRRLDDADVLALEDGIKAAREQAVAN